MTAYLRDYPEEFTTFPNNTARSFFRKRKGYVTKPKGKEMTEFTVRQAKSYSGSGRYVDGYPYYGRPSNLYIDAPNAPASHEQTVGLWSSYDAQLANNAAYEQLIDRLHDKASLLVTLAERREAADMLVSRLVSLAATIRHARKGNITKAVRTLFGNDPKGRPLKSGSVSGTHLEIQYGWGPTIADIHSILEVLDSDYPSAKITGRGRSGGSTSRGGGDYNWEFEGVRYYTCRKTAYVSVENPLLYRLNQAGVINPLTVAWELVPFSFVIDWFVPVGNWLAAQSDFVGLNVVGCESMVAICEEDQWYNQPIYAEVPRAHISAMNYERRLGISGPSLAIPPVSQGINWMRAANAAALIHQLLK